MEIAIDGAAASGKTVVGREVSRQLDLRFLDTGLMYRAAAWLCLRNDIDLENVASTTQAVSSTDIELNHVGGRNSIILDGENITEELYGKDIDETVSIVASIKGVRQSLVKQQKFIAQAGSIVMVGRDIGTVVMPDANLKVFLEASLEVRVRRRLSEAESTVGKSTFSQIKNNITMRDETDSTRKESPLRPAEDALLIDTTTIGIQAVVDRIVSLAKKI